MDLNELRLMIREQIEHLSYDEIDLDLDVFTNKKLVGRSFKSEKEALDYLSLALSSEKEGRSVEDFIIRNTDSVTLSPYKIYPKPNDFDLKRKKAIYFLKTHGISSSPDSRYIVHPLNHYVFYKDAEAIKNLGIRYKFTPIQEIPLNHILSYFIKKKLGETNTISNQMLLGFYNLESEFDKDYVLDLKNKVEGALRDFNNLLGCQFFIEKTKVTESDSSLKSSLLNKLDDKNYVPNKEFDKTYKNVIFLLNRDYKNEEEFLIVIPMEKEGIPKMK